MTKRTAITLAVVLALWVLERSCQYQRGATDARWRASGQTTDAARAVTDRRVTELARREVERESTLVRTRRELAKARREIATFRQRVAPIDTTLPAAARAQLALRDSIIARQDVVIAQQDTALTLYRARVLARDTIIGELRVQRDAYRAQRDAWRKQAQPGLLERGRRALPWALAAVVVWEFARE